MNPRKFARRRIDIAGATSTESKCDCSREKWNRLHFQQGLEILRENVDEKKRVCGVRKREEVYKQGTFEPDILLC